MTDSDKLTKAHETKKKSKVTSACLNSPLALIEQDPCTTPIWVKRSHTLIVGSRLSLPAEPFHVPRCREAMHNFTVYVHHVMRVGHLASPMVWRSLLYPSPARLPLAWGVTQLPLPLPHDLP